jgi:hypothetical protein
MNTWTRVSVVGITALSMLGWTAGAYAAFGNIATHIADSKSRTTESYGTDKHKAARKTVIETKTTKSATLTKPPIHRK